MLSAGRRVGFPTKNPFDESINCPSTQNRY